MGRAKKMIDELIAKKSNGNKYLEHKIKIALVLKGVMVDHITASTPDEKEIIETILKVAKEFNIKLTN